MATRLAAWTIAFASLAGSTLAGPIEVHEITRKTDAGPIHGFVAVIDLKDPTLEIIGPAPLASDGKRHANAESKLEPTDRWAARVGAELAINTNYFGKLESAKDLPPSAHGYAAGLEADIIGLCVSDGVVISEPREVAGVGDPGVVIHDDGTAAAGRFTKGQLDHVRFGVAGVGKSTSGQDDLPGTLLVERGKNIGSGARVEADKRNPRTAIGVTKDATHLVVAVIDGREDTHSVGVTLPELADIMIEQGAVDAVNLDGGGSSAFIYTPHATVNSPGSREPGKTIVNRPSDGGFRPVAASLGFRVRQSKEADKPVSDRAR